MRDEATGDNLALARAALPAVGDVLVGKYRIEKVVGEGGMGVVFAARHEALDQLVAVKVLLADAAKGEGVIERFVREAQAAARLQSEHVARVFDAGSLENDVPFLVMEYLEGCDLEELLKLNGTLAVADACDYILQALAAMAQAHAVGIIHRDLKPANLFLAVRPDGSNVIKILDFGISKQTTSHGREKSLTGRAVLGSPAYMPPEQLRNAKGVDVRADIWSLGIVLYEMLTGAPPFDGEGVGEIFAAILEQDPPAIREKRPEVPPELEEVIFKCVRRKPEERWQTVGELAVALEPFGSGKWGALVSMIASTLARSERLRAMQTPPEMRLANAQAAARSTNTPTLDEPTSPPSAKVAFTRTDDHLPAIRLPTPTYERPKRSKTGLVVATTALVIVGGAGFLMRGYLRPKSASPPVAASPPPPAEPSAAVDTTADQVATPTLTMPASPVGSDTGTRAVASASAPASASGKAWTTRRPGSQRPGRGLNGTGAASPPAMGPSARPGFLNSRE